MLIGSFRNLNFHNSMRHRKMSAPNKEPIVTAPTHSPFHQRLMHALRSWRRRAAERRRSRADSRHLAGMSDHELRDLGIGRSQVIALLDEHKY
jgi:uncharacterized protein YjiS (DUF1127 family)